MSSFGLELQLKHYVIDKYAWTLETTSNNFFRGFGSELRIFRWYVWITTQGSYFYYKLEKSIFRKLPFFLNRLNSFQCE